MKIEHVENIDKLFDVIQKCKGRIDLVSVDMALNLKSDIARYFAMTEIFKNREARNLELVVYDPEDRERIQRFIEEERNADESRKRKCVWIGERDSSK